METRRGLILPLWRAATVARGLRCSIDSHLYKGSSGLVAEYIVAINEPRARFPADALGWLLLKIKPMRRQHKPLVHTWTGQPHMTPAGLEPVIPSSVSRYLIHWAAGPLGLS